MYFIITQNQVWQILQYFNEEINTFKAYLISYLEWCNKYYKTAVTEKFSVFWDSSKCLWYFYVHTMRLFLFLLLMTWKEVAHPSSKT